MAEIIQPESVDMFQMDLEHIHAVLRNRSYDMESLMRQVSAVDIASFTGGSDSRSGQKSISVPAEMKFVDQKLQRKTTPSLPEPP
jgi:hypothetical protein